jgi:hypothetical protein
VSSKIVLKVVFLERDFERDHLAEKSNRTKIGQKIHCASAKCSKQVHGSRVFSFLFDVVVVFFSFQNATLSPARLI